MPDHNTLSHTSLMRSGTIAGWFTLHVYAACELTRVAFGTFDKAGSPPGTFVPADLSQVLEQLSIHLHPLVVFGLVFLAFTGMVYAAGLLWWRLLRVLNAEALDAQTASALSWSIKRQFTLVWLAAALALGGAAWLAVVLGYPTISIVIFTVGTYAAPLLILRPRWLDAQSEDQSWLPGRDASIFYMAVSAAWIAIQGAITWLGLPVVKVAAFALDLVIGLIQDSVLVHARTRREIWPHVTLIWRRRIWLFALLVVVRPLAVLTRWVLPPLGLAFYFSVFVEPAVLYLAPHLPEVPVLAARSFSEATHWVRQFWWVVVPIFLPWMSLYTGRSVVLFKEQHASVDR